MQFNQNEQALLNLLADEWDKSGPPGYLETSVIAHRSGVSVADAKSSVRSLFVKGMVDTNEVGKIQCPVTFRKRDGRHE
jgi:hypothetical protein